MLHRQYVIHCCRRRSETKETGLWCDVVDDWSEELSTAKWPTHSRQQLQDLSISPPTAVREVLKNIPREQDNHKILFSLVVFEDGFRAHEEPVPALT